MIAMHQVAGYTVGKKRFMRAQLSPFAYNRAWSESQRTGLPIVTVPR